MDQTRAIENGRRPAGGRGVAPRSGHTWLATLLLATMVVLPAVAWAARPLETEDTGTADPGRVELELSGDWVRERHEEVWTPKAVLAVGVLPGLELRLESTYLFLEPDEGESESGVGDLLLGAKYRLLDERPNFPAVLAGFTLRLPTGDEERGLGEEDVDAGLVLAVSKTFGPVTLTANAGYTFVTLGRTFDTWTLSGAVEYRLTPAWSLVAEAVGTLPNGTPLTTLVVRGGTAYAITDRIKVDAGLGFGATRDSPDVMVTLGVTFSF